MLVASDGVGGAWAGAVPEGWAGVGLGLGAGLLGPGGTIGGGLWVGGCAGGADKVCAGAEGSLSPTAASISDGKI